MLDSESQSLHDIILSEGLCTEEQLQEAAEEQERNGKSYKEVLIDFGLLTEQQILEAISSNLMLDLISIPADMQVPEEVIAKVPPDTARMLGVFPLAFDGTTLTVALRTPLNYQVIDELRFVVGTDVIQVLAPEEQVEKSIEKYYPLDVTQSMQDMLEEMSKDQSPQAALDEIETTEDLEKQANDAPIVKFVDAVIYQAIKDKASDIHFEPFEKNFRIRCRVDGALYELPPPPKSLAIPVISRVKLMSSMNISERRKPQDGRIQTRVGSKAVDLRVSTLPTQFGESCVLRVLDRSVVNLDLDALGIDEKNLAKIRDLIHMPNGIFVVTGPTGSGKTTTLYSALKEINTVGDKILTAEDPVEYDLEGIIQLPINEGIGMTFGRALRAFLRQDPDVIMLGEIRDLESARMAVEASLTGHFVFSTLHTNDAAGSVTRFIDMGVEPYLITSSMVGCIGQRLIRRVCPKCKTPFEPSDDDLWLLGLEREELNGRPFYYGRGCDHCNHTGYKGRKALTEVLTMNPEINELVLQNMPTVVIRDKAREQGMRTMREDGLNAILNGETTMEEVLKYT